MPVRKDEEVVYILDSSSDEESTQSEKKANTKNHVHHTSHHLHLDRVICPKKAKLVRPQCDDVQSGGESEDTKTKEALRRELEVISNILGMTPEAIQDWTNK